jgi:hypothetical protein
LVRADDSSVTVVAVRDVAVAEILSDGSGAGINLKAGDAVSDAGDAGLDLVVVDGLLTVEAQSVGMRNANALETNVALLNATIGSGGIALSESNDLTIVDLGSIGNVQMDIGGGLVVDQLSSDGDVDLSVVNNVHMLAADSRIRVLSGLLELDAGGNVGDGVVGSGLPLWVESDRLSLGAGGDVSMHSPILNDLQRLVAGGTINWQTTASLISGLVRSDAGLIDIIATDLDIGVTGEVQSTNGRLHITPTGEFLVGSSGTPSVFDLTDAEWDRVQSPVVQVFAPSTIVVEEAWTLDANNVNTLHLETPATIDISNGSLEANQLAVEATGLNATGANQINTLAYDVTGQFDLNNVGDLQLDTVDEVSLARYVGGSPQVLSVGGALHLGIDVKTSSTGLSSWNVTGPLTQSATLLIDRLTLDAADTVTLDLSNDFDELSLVSLGRAVVADIDDLVLADSRSGADVVAPDLQIEVGGDLFIDGQVSIANEWKFATVGSVFGAAQHEVTATTLTAEAGGTIGTRLTPIETIRALCR